MSEQNLCPGHCPVWRSVLGSGDCPRCSARGTGTAFIPYIICVVAADAEFLESELPVWCFMLVFSGVLFLLELL